MEPLPSKKQEVPLNNQDNQDSPRDAQEILSKDRIIRVITANREETVAIGTLLGKLLRAGDVVCLDGDLGAGKTAFTAGIAKGMGIRGVIASPTFTILIEHTKQDSNGSGSPLYHFDAYRLSGEDDFYNLGFDEYFSCQGVCVIEWADRIRAAVPCDAVWVTLRQGTIELSDQRVMTFSFPRKDTRTDLFIQKTTGGEWRRP